MDSRQDRFFTWILKIYYQSIDLPKKVHPDPKGLSLLEENHLEVDHSKVADQDKNFKEVEIGKVEEILEVDMLEVILSQYKKDEK